MIIKYYYHTFVPPSKQRKKMHPHIFPDSNCNTPSFAFSPASTPHPAPQEQDQQKFYQCVNPRLIFQWEGASLKNGFIHGKGLFCVYERIGRDLGIQKRLLMSVECQNWVQNIPQGQIEFTFKEYYASHSQQSKEIMEKTRKFIGEFKSMHQHGQGEEIIEKIYFNGQKQLIRISGEWRQGFLVDRRVKKTLMKRKQKQENSFRNNIEMILSPNSQKSEKKERKSKSQAKLKDENQHKFQSFREKCESMNKIFMKRKPHLQFCKKVKNERKRI